MDETKQSIDSKPGGILRVDITKPRRSSGSSVEFRQPDRLGLELLENLSPSSPQPSVDRLSVTWADAEDSSSRVNVFTPGSPPATKMEVRFPEEEASEDEDYSASVSAIMQRRVSTRRSKRATRGSTSSRRTSSPFIPEIPGSARRRSSAYTTSSGETAISIEDVQEVTQEQIYENIRLHKEVLGSVKQQPWGMRRKLRLVSQAKTYIKKHEGTLQERLAKNKCTRDILARFNILMARQWQRLKREAANLSNWMIPWELRIKEIESHFGSVVASYFTFLRWLFWVNFVISIILVLFVVVPEILTADKDAGERKEMLPEEKINSTNLRTLTEFEGVLKYSPIFYGFYNIRKPNAKGGYHLPMAYLMTGIAVYIYSFVAILRKMAENSRMSKLSEKEDECIFSWKLFTGWDYMIGNAETAHNKTASIILGFKEALLEEAEKIKDIRNWKIIFKRVLVNSCILVLLSASAYAVVEVVRRSKLPGAKSNWWRQNEITIVISLISFVFPMFFELLGFFESYHPRRQLRIQLARIMVLNLLNLYSLIFALFDKISDMTKELRILNPNNTVTIGPSTTHDVNVGTTLSSVLENISRSTISTSSFDFETTFEPETTTICYKVFVPCPTIPVMTMKNITASMMSIFLLNQTSIEPTMLYNQNYSDVSNNNYTDFYSIDSDYNITGAPNVTDFNSTYFHWETSTTPTSRFNENITYYYNTDYANYTDEEFDYKFVEEDDNYSNDEAHVTVHNYTEASDIQRYNTSITTEEALSTFPLHKLGMSFKTTEPTYKESSTQEKIGFYQEPCYIMKCDNDNPSTSKNTLDSKVTIKKELAPKHNALITDKYVFKSAASSELNITIRRKLRGLCWETMFGQELVKLTMMDLFLTILATLGMDFFRALFVRFMNRCWCWDLEKTFPSYGDFKIAENILHLVNNQGMVWMGMFFSPGLVVLNLVKLIILMYLRSWAVMTCNIPHSVVFRASRSNNFYLALLLTMIFLCVLPVGYAIVWVEPSWHCGPFSNYQRIYHLFTQSLQSILSPTLRRALDYIASPGIVIPLLVLLILIIYYLLSLTGSLREANNDLKIQLRRERTEERRKMFQIADKKSRGDTNELDNTPFAKWRKILPVIPANKADDNNEENAATSGNGKMKFDKKDSLAKLVKLALRKSSGTSDDESGLVVPQPDDETDTEFHESLPDDVLIAKDIQLPNKSVHGKSNVPTHKKKHHIKHSDTEKKGEHNENGEHSRRAMDLGAGQTERDNGTKNKEKKQRRDIHINIPVNGTSQEIVEIEKVKNIDEATKSSQDGNSPREFKNVWKGKLSLKKEVPKVSEDTQDDVLNSIIPVITISKTASEENVLKQNENNESIKLEDQNHVNKKPQE